MPPRRSSGRRSDVLVKISMPQNSRKRQLSTSNGGRASTRASISSKRTKSDPASSIAQGTPTRSKYFPKTESEESDSPQEEGDAEDDTVYDTESSASISDLASETDDDFSDRFSGRKSKLAT